MTNDASPADEALPPGMAVLWRRDDARLRPGRRPTLTLDQIAAAAVQLADAEGLAGVSMARVAGRLGVTTMALYRYVESKDELLGLMTDRAMAPPELAADGGWRARLETWCHAQLDLVRRHPWVVRVAGLPPIGPNRLRWVEAGLAALDGTGLPADLRVAVVGMLSLHVLTEGQVLAAYLDQQAGHAVDHPALIDYGRLLRAVADPVEYPRVAAAAAAGAFDDDSDGPEGQERLALALLLDGIEAMVARYDRRAA